MSDPQGSHTTRLVRSLALGEPGAADALLPFVYDELHRVAERLMRREVAGHTLQPTALVHEAFLRLVDAGDRDWENRRHFLRVAASAMRRVLVDAARARGADKRGGGRHRIRATWSDEVVADEAPADVLEVDLALARLAEGDAQLAEIVELRFFAGLEFQDVAEVLGMNLRTLERRWRFARTWLAREITALRSG